MKPARCGAADTTADVSSGRLSMRPFRFLRWTRPCTPLAPGGEGCPTGVHALPALGTARTFEREEHYPLLATEDRPFRPNRLY